MRRPLAILLVVYLLGLVVVTLGPSSTPSTAVEKTATEVDRASQSDGASPNPTQRQRSLADTALNVLLFLPCGCLVLLLWPSWRWWAVVAAGASLSAAIELSQRWIFTWRDSQLSDLLTNTVGTTLGCALASTVLRRRCRRRVKTDPLSPLEN